MAANEVQRNILAKAELACNAAKTTALPKHNLRNRKFNARNCAGGTGKPEPENYCRPATLVFIIRRIADKVTNPAKRARRRARAETRRMKSGAPHIVEYFHQLDDPYSHLTAQVLAKFAARYNIVIKPHLINATGGKNQPRLAELAVCPP